MFQGFNKLHCVSLLGDPLKIKFVIEGHITHAQFEFMFCCLHERNNLMQPIDKTFTGGPLASGARKAVAE